MLHILLGALLLLAAPSYAEFSVGVGDPLANLPGQAQNAETELDAGLSAAVVARGAEVLNGREERAVRNALKAARAGAAPDLNSLPSLLHGHVQAAYLLGRHNASAAELNSWLSRYGSNAMATEVYRVAEAKRAKPRQVCTTKSVKPKATKKNKKPKARKVKSCRTVGEYGPMPPQTAAMLARADRKEAATAAQNQRRAGLSAEGRALASQVWGLRARGDYKGALAALLEPSSRLDLGGVYWQDELVKLADFYHGKREWQKMYQAASAASKVQGPQRDEALWLAGFAAYRAGERGQAAGYWERLVREEPKNGNHYGRAAWWGARVLNDLGRSRDAEDLLAAAAERPLTFYGQLAAMRLGREARLDFSAPGVPSQGLAALLANRQARTGLALAQVNEREWAEAELRTATPNLPLSANAALAGLAVSLDLPSTALRAGRDIYEEGEIVGGALFPLPTWRPQGGWQFDRAFMLGLMRQESAFQPKIGSHVGAQGLMQIMPATGRYIAGMTGRKNYRGTPDLHTPAVNLAMAQDYLNYLSRRLNGNLLFVAAAYNGGIGNVQRWVANGVTPDTDPLLWLESIPFDETRDYVEKVMLNTWMYQQRLGQPRTTLKQLAAGRWPNN